MNNGINALSPFEEIQKSKSKLFNQSCIRTPIKIMHSDSTDRTTLCNLRLQSHVQKIKKIKNLSPQKRMKIYTMNQVDNNAKFS